MRKPKSNPPIKLQPGRFYRSRDGEVWCCYRVDTKKPEHCQADCIRVTDSRVEYFYRDGRYDGAGMREHCLIVECASTGASLPAGDVSEVGRRPRRSRQQELLDDDGPTHADEDVSRMEMVEGTVAEAPYGGEDGEP